MTLFAGVALNRFEWVKNSIYQGVIFVSIIEETYLQMNKENQKRKWITKAFEKCFHNLFMDDKTDC